MSKLLVAAGGGPNRRHRGAVGPGPEPPGDGEPPLAGREGVQESAGLQVNGWGTDAVPADQIATYQGPTQMNRVVNFHTSNIGWEYRGSTPYGQALNEDSVANFVNPSKWRSHPEVTMATTFALTSAPVGGGKPTFVNRRTEINKVAAGQYDSVFLTIAGRIADYIDPGDGGCKRPIIRLAHEPEILGYPWSFMGIEPSVWTDGAWTRVATILRGDPVDAIVDMTLNGVTYNAPAQAGVGRVLGAGTPNVYLDFQGDGPWMRKTYSQQVADINTREGADRDVPVPDPPIDTEVWRRYLPHTSMYEMIGHDDYAGAKTPADLLEKLDALQQVALALGKPFTVPELGCAAPQSLTGTADNRGPLNLLDDPTTPSDYWRSVKRFMQAWVAKLEGYPASGAGSCWYWSYFEQNFKYYAMRKYWPHTWLWYRQNVGEG